jgi:hypothetical protein
MKHPRTPDKTGYQNWQRLPFARFGLALASLGGCYILIWLYLGPSARYHASAPVFCLDYDFFRPRLRRPGGLLEYAGGFLAQLDYRPWLGALVFAAMLALISLGTKRWVERKLGGRGLGWALPGLILLALYGRYELPVWDYVVGVLLVVGALVFWPSGKPGSRAVRLMVIGGLLLALYYVAGWLAGLWFVAVLGLGAAVGRWVPALASGNPILPAQHSPKPRGAAGTRRPRWVKVVHVGVGALVLALLITSFNPNRRTLPRLHSAAEREDWKGVLAAAANVRDYPVPARLQINRALYHLDRLTSDLFVYPRRSGGDMLASLADGLDVCVPLSDTLLELGHVNLAEHYIHEAVEVRGDRPELLWRLARINMVKERPEAARVFLNRLGRAPFHRARADRWLEAIARDRELADETEIVRLRSLRPTEDWVERVFSTENLLRQLLEANRHNRMAVDYLMAHFLLSRQPQGVAQNLGRLDDAGNSLMPRHLAEAVVLLTQVQPSQTLDLHGHAIEPEMVRRFDRFRAALAGPEAAEAPPYAFDRDFGDTYWYYEWFGRNPGRSSRPYLNK